MTAVASDREPPIYPVRAYRVDSAVDPRAAWWCCYCNYWHGHGYPGPGASRRRVAPCVGDSAYNSPRFAEIELHIVDDTPAHILECIHAGTPPPRDEPITDRKRTAKSNVALFDQPPPLSESDDDLAAFSAADFADEPVPAREWLVPGLIPLETVTLLTGDGGTGKSLLAQHLGTCVVTGVPFLGLQTARGAVLAFFAEDDKSELHRRQDAICRALGVDLKDLVELDLAPRSGEDNVLAFYDREGRPSVTRLAEQLARRIALTRPVLVILDNLAELFGGDENVRVQARAFITFLQRLCRDYGVTILLLAHPSLTGINSGSGSSGSTAWSNSVRSRLYLERPRSDDNNDPDLRVLTTKKANYAAAGTEIRMRWTDGAFVPVDLETPLDRLAGQSRADRVFLRLLRRVTEEGRHVSAAPTSAAYAAKLFARQPDSEGISKRDFEGAIQRLFAQRKVREQTGGKPSRPTRWIVESNVSGETE